MRLDRFLAESTGMSRKDAGRQVRAGEVTVNGRVNKKGAYQVQAEDEVIWRDIIQQPPGSVYYMLHKPAGCVCTHDDPAHISAFALVDHPDPGKLHAAGRLDADTTGLVLITSDGQWSHRITSPRYACPKTYRVWSRDPVTEQQLQQLRNGVQLRGEERATAPAQAELLADREVLLTITEGRYHQVKRMVAAVGNQLDALHREQVGSLALDADLQPGEYRELTTAEIQLF